MENKSEGNKKLDSIDRLAAGVVGDASESNRSTIKDTIDLAKQAAEKNPEEFLNIARESQQKQMQREGLISTNDE